MQKHAIVTVQNKK